jgi:hypothetical protein
LCNGGELLLREIPETPSYISFFQNCVSLPLFGTKEDGKVIIGYFVLRIEKKKAEMDMECFPV